MTFDIESLVSYETQLHIIVNIFTKCHEDITKTCEVIMAYTRYKLQNFDLWPLSVTLTFDIESWEHRVMGLVRDMPTYHSEHFNQLAWRYNNNLWSYGPVKVKLQNFDLWTLNVTLTFDIVMGLVQDTPIYHSEHFY